MKTISCLFLDIGGVLLSKGWGPEFRQQAVDHFKLDYKEMGTRHAMMFAPLEEGKITIQEYLNRVVFYTPRDFTQTEFIDFMKALSTPDIKMIEFIKKLKNKYKLKIIAVSNESRALNSYRINTFKLHEIFDFFISSCFVGARKPDKTIFNLALDGAQVPLDEILYIDDTALFIEIAADLGIKGIHHTDLETTVSTMAALGLGVPFTEAKKTNFNTNKQNADSTENKKIIGIAADHGGFELKKQLVELLHNAGYEIRDFGAFQIDPDDDYPDFVIPLARAVSNGELQKGIAICGSGVGACIVANKIDGVRSALITEDFSAHQGVEDDNMNLMCLGGKITSTSIAWELVQKFITAHFKSEERFQRRLDKVSLLEKKIK